MANPTHGTLAATVVSTVSIPAGAKQAALLHESPTDANPISVRLDGTDPVLYANTTYTVLPGTRRVFKLPSEDAATSFRMISAGSPRYELEVA